MAAELDMSVNILLNVYFCKQKDTVNDEPSKCEEEKQAVKKRTKYLIDEELIEKYNKIRKMAAERDMSVDTALIDYIKTHYNEDIIKKIKNDLTI